MLLGKLGEQDFAQHELEHILTSGLTFNPVLVRDINIASSF